MNRAALLTHFDDNDVEIVPEFSEDDGAMYHHPFSRGSTYVPFEEEYSDQQIVIMCINLKIGAPAHCEDLYEVMLNHYIPFPLN